LSATAWTKGKVGVVGRAAGKDGTVDCIAEAREGSIGKEARKSIWEDSASLWPPFEEKMRKDS